MGRADQGEGGWWCRPATPPRRPPNSPHLAGTNFWFSEVMNGGELWAHRCPAKNNATRRWRSCRSRSFPPTSSSATCRRSEHSQGHLQRRRPASRGQADSQIADRHDAHDPATRLPSRWWGGVPARLALVGCCGSCHSPRKVANVYPFACVTTLYPIRSYAPIASFNGFSKRMTGLAILCVDASCTRLA